MNAHDFFSTLEDDASFDRGSSNARQAPARPTFPCMSCHGTGRYRGVRVHQVASECFACGGKGFFYTSQQDRAKAKASSQARKARVIAETISAFKEQEPGLYEFLASASWSLFLTEMKQRLDTGKDLTEGQIAAIRNTQAKSLARQAEKAAEKIARSVDVDLSPIHAMFDKARENGLSRLAYRAEGLVLSPASSTSANAGAIYVKTKGGEYLGKVVGTKFMATREATPDHKAAIEVIARNPAEAATAYGKRTGECSCCGRELTDPVSIERGIGPICADKWGF